MSCCTWERAKLMLDSFLKLFMYVLNHENAWCFMTAYYWITLLLTKTVRWMVMVKISYIKVEFGINPTFRNIFDVVDFSIWTQKRCCNMGAFLKTIKWSNTLSASKYICKKLTWGFEANEPCFKIKQYIYKFKRKKRRMNNWYETRKETSNSLELYSNIQSINWKIV